VAKRGQMTLVAGEPDLPKLVTEIPGPISKQKMSELNDIQAMGSVQVKNAKRHTRGRCYKLFWTPSLGV